MAALEPLVSIITATYNRSNVLRYAIASVLRSTFTNWEMIIVGDACTDDTEQLVASFQDSRIKFYNLSENFGEQSGPNNEGFRYARGQYIAYLNHDDLWFPDHLQTLLQGIESYQADLVYSLGLRLGRDGMNSLIGTTFTGEYTPHTGAPASLWLLRREMVDEIGPWQAAWQCYAVPSQNWLHRSWRAKKKLVCIPELTVLVIESGARLNSYANREFEEHQQCFDRMLKEPDFRLQELAKQAVYQTAQASDLRLRPPLRRLLRNILYRFLIAFGVLPSAFFNLVIFRRKGGFIDFLRHRRGLQKRRLKTTFDS